jgi:uncharacterized membrane protein YjdF
MEEILYFTLTGILVYLLADWIIRRIERSRGRVLEQRQVVFFAIFLILILVAFEIVPRIVGN